MPNAFESDLPGVPTSVYQYRDVDGELLYVGITGRGIKRSKEHERIKSWWSLAVSCSIEHYPNREEALNRESYLIKYWRPPHNVLGRPSELPRHSRRAVLPEWRNHGSAAQSLAALAEDELAADGQSRKTPQQLIAEAEVLLCRLKGI